MNGLPDSRVGAPCYHPFRIRALRRKCLRRTFAPAQRLWQSPFRYLVIAAPGHARASSMRQRLLTGGYSPLRIRQDPACSRCILRSWPHPVLLKYTWCSPPQVIRRRQAAGIVHPARPFLLPIRVQCDFPRSASSLRKPDNLCRHIDVRRSSWMNYKTGQWSGRAIACAFDLTSVWGSPDMARGTPTISLVLLRQNSLAMILSRAI